VFTDPLSVTYNGSAKSLPRVGLSSNRSQYRAADGEFEVVITKNFPKREAWRTTSIYLVRHIPDPTPTDVFDNYRDIRNSFGITYSFDLTKDEASVDLPRLRTALLSFADSAFEGRLWNGEM
jgi:hypothetical protein